MEIYQALSTFAMLYTGNSLSFRGSEPETLILCGYLPECLMYSMRVRGSSVDVCSGRAHTHQFVHARTRKAGMLSIRTSGERCVPTDFGTNMSPFFGSLHVIAYRSVCLWR